MDNGLVHLTTCLIQQAPIVLILIVVDNGLVLVLKTEKGEYLPRVLILIVVDNGLVQKTADDKAAEAE